MKIEATGKHFAQMTLIHVLFFNMSLVAPGLVAAHLLLRLLYLFLKILYTFQNYQQT
jgi:hypothetical protein